MQQPFQTTLFGALSLALQSFLPTKATRDCCSTHAALLPTNTTFASGRRRLQQMSFRANAGRLLLTHGAVKP